MSITAWMIVLAAGLVLAWVWAVVKAGDDALDDTATDEAWHRGRELFIDPPIRLPETSMRAPHRSAGARIESRTDGAARERRNDTRARRVRTSRSIRRRRLELVV